MRDPTSSAETCTPIGSADIRNNPRMSVLTTRNTSPPPVTKTIRAAAAEKTPMNSTPIPTLTRKPFESVKMPAHIEIGIYRIMRHTHGPSTRIGPQSEYQTSPGNSQEIRNTPPLTVRYEAE